MSSSHADDSDPIPLEGDHSWYRMLGRIETQLKTMRAEHREMREALDAHVADERQKFGVLEEQLAAIYTGARITKWVLGAIAGAVTFGVWVSKTFTIKGP